MHPILIHTSFFTIYTFWIFFALALVSGTYLLIKLAKLNNLKIQFLSDNIMKIILVSLLSSRIVFIAINWQSYFYEISSETLLSTLFIWDKGLSPWGALLGFIIFFYFLCKQNEQNFEKWLDIMAPSILLIFAISSLGAFFDGINYGKETSLPWGVNFESPTIQYTVPIHPTQIYAFIYGIALTITIILLKQSIKIKNKRKTGIIAILSVFLYSIFRFLEEFFRGDYTLELIGIRIPQILAGLTIVISGIFLFKKYNQKAISEINTTQNEKPA